MAHHHNGSEHSENGRPARLSVVIPAHNEERAIGRLIGNLLRGARPGELEIIVACNGCTDRTAEAARAYGADVRVVETAVASKTAALNLGDEAATVFPRIYIDADVSIDTDGLRKVAAALGGRVLAAAPSQAPDCTRSSWPVKAFYDLWTCLPYVRGEMIGSGCYALSEEGRSLFGRFPDIIADDGFVRLQFQPDQRTAVAEARCAVIAPADLVSLIKIKTRSRLGGYELARKYPTLQANDQKKYGMGLAEVLRRPRLWACLPVYLFVNAVSRFRARHQLRSLASYVWERDETSRRTGAPNPVC
jgi:glycosyltransferase involved in cell wall biosynthesis